MQNEAIPASVHLRPVPALKTSFPVHNIFDSLLEVVCAINVDGLFEYVSRAAHDVWGYHPDELIGLSYTDFLAKRDRKKTVAIIERLQRGEDILFFENNYLHKCGTSIPLLWTARWDARDKMVYCVARDRSSMQEIESLNLSYAEEIERQGRETVNILERIKDGFFALDKTGNVTYWNKEAENITGKTREEVLGKSLWNSFSKMEGSKFEGACREAVASGTTIQYETYYTHLQTWFEVSIFSSDTGLSVFFKDISGRRNLQDEMRRLSLIARETANAVVITDAAGTITWVNEAFTALSGYSYAEARGHKPSALLSGADTDSTTLAYIAEQVKEAQPFRAEVLNYKKCGEAYWTEISGQPVFNEEGVLEQFFSIELDITEKRKMQERLRAETEGRQKKITAAVLHAQEKERAEIGRDLHDNISQVLTTVQLYNEACLQDGAESEKLLAQSISLLKGAIQEVRGISKMLSAPAVGASRLFDSITGLVACVRLTARVKISLDAPGLEEIVVSECLHIAVYRIVQEHLTNILKHAKADAVEVTIRKTAKSLSVWITDDGIGFDVHNTREGIGINNMMSRAESLNGSLRIISTSGNGCNLLATFPLI